jgi:hypothetical protein
LWIGAFEKVVLIFIVLVACWTSTVAPESPSVHVLFPNWCKSLIVTAYETDEIIRSLISAHPDTGAYSSEAVAKLGFPFDDSHSVDDIMTALSYLVDECDVANTDQNDILIILRRLNSAVESGIIDKFCESGLESFLKKAWDTQTNDTVLSMEEVGLFRDLFKALKYNNSKSESKTEHSHKQQKISDTVKRCVTTDNPAKTDSESSTDDSF